MSAIEDFCRSHDTETNRNADDIFPQWVHEKEVDNFLSTPVTGGVLLGDLLCGDGLEDQVSSYLLRGPDESRDSKTV